MAAPNLSPIQWTCVTCGFPIADGTGCLGVPFAQLAAWPDDDPAWRAQHNACIDPGRDVYGIDVEQIRDAAGLLRWTVHLMEKSWFVDSNWRGVLAVAMKREAG